MFLKNKNIIFKIRRSKVTDYAALSPLYLCKIKVDSIIMLLLSNSSSLYGTFFLFNRSLVSNIMAEALAPTLPLKTLRTTLIT